MQCFQIILLLPAAHNHHGIIVTCQDEIDQQPRDTSVTVLERMDPDIPVVEKRCQLQWVILSGGLSLVVPIHEVRHQRSGLLRCCVFETVSIASDHTVRTCLVAAGVNDITRHRSIRKSPVNGIVLPEQRLVQLTDEGLREGCIFQRGLLLHHQKSHIAGLHLFEVLHLGLAHHLAK